MTNQNGYTVIEVLTGVALVATLMTLVAFVYGAAHFIAKFW